jgi:hypothetical protein
VAAVALLESLSADGVLSLGAAAVTHLIKYHVVSCDDACRVDLLGAVASEVGLTVDNSISAAATNHISSWESKSLTLGQRRIRKTASAVLDVNAVDGSLIEAWALLTNNNGERRWLAWAITNVNKGLSCGIELLSACASLNRRERRIAGWLLNVYGQVSWDTARARLCRSVSSNNLNAWALRSVLC